MSDVIILDAPYFASFSSSCLLSLPNEIATRSVSNNFDTSFAYDIASKVLFLKLPSQLSAYINTDIF